MHFSQNDGQEKSAESVRKGTATLAIYAPSFDDDHAETMAS